MQNDLTGLEERKEEVAPGLQALLGIVSKAWRGAARGFQLREI